MNKNWTLRVACAIFVATLVTLTAVGGTFAKYTKTVTGTDSARVAKFDVKTGDLTETIALFNTSYGTSVVSSNTDKVVAPGTSGSFSFDIKNDSEVNVDYLVGLAITNDAGVPLEWSLDDTEYSSTLPSFETTELAIGGQTTITVYWRWAFTTEGNASDSSDTAFGEAETLANITVSITTTFNQID